MGWGGSWQSEGWLCLMVRNVWADAKDDGKRWLERRCQLVILSSLLFLGGMG